MAEFKFQLPVSMNIEVPKVYGKKLSGLLNDLNLLLVKHASEKGGLRVSIHQSSITQTKITKAFRAAMSEKGITHTEGARDVRFRNARAIEKANITRRATLEANRKAAAVSSGATLPPDTAE